MRPAPPSTSSSAASTGTHPLTELGLVVERDGAGLRGGATLDEMMRVPGTDNVRTSILAAWADTVLGLLAIDSIAPRVPVTLELDVHLVGRPPGTGSVTALGRVAKAGSSVVASTIEFLDDEGQRFGFGHSMFMTNPDARKRMPAGDWALDQLGARRGTLTEPFAQRVGCHRGADGTARIGFNPDLGNSSQTMNGGILALAVEEAVLGLEPPGTTIASMTLRYLRPVRTGPAIARADCQGGLADVNVVDGGSGVLAMLATTRTFPARRPPARP